MIFFKYLKSYFNYSFNGRASKNEFIRLSVLNLVFLFFNFALLQYLGPWPCALIGFMIWLNQGAVLFRRRHDFCKQRETSALSRGNMIEDIIDFVSLFSLPSDEGENKYGPEPWDSKD